MDKQQQTSDKLTTGNNNYYYKYFQFLLNWSISLESLVQLVPLNIFLLAQLTASKH